MKIPTASMQNIFIEYFKTFCKVECGRMSHCILSRPIFFLFSLFKLIKPGYNVNGYITFLLGLYRKNSTLKDVRIFAPAKIFLLGEKLPKSSGITHMVTSNVGHPLHHHQRHSSRLSNSLFNRRTIKQTFTQWPQASAL
jgi:hypothetical protein